MIRAFVYGMRLMNYRLLFAVSLLAASASAFAEEVASEAKADARPVYRSAQQIIDAATEADWRTPSAQNLLYMQLPTGLVVIELAPDFAPLHVANVRTLAKEGFWDNTSIYRSQDNFVVQFGDADGEDPAKAKSLGSARTHLPAEFTRKLEGMNFTRLPDVDGWAKQVGFVDGFPVGVDPVKGEAWLAHCYGTVGAGRNEADDSSIGAELYVAIGQSPRQLDHQLSTIGVVRKGMELLSTIKRGPPPMGMIEKPEDRTPILSVKLGSEVPESQRVNLQVMKTESATFAAMVEARRNRVDGFYKVPAGHIDLCNIPVPVREK